ncbi:alginate O-acetyltransferase [Betaproteobacteria bacterium]|nr:alginate O-acetyltransferase [Betaproteobacteria bacterium]GHU21793.1 alginate O-acetyltransferase [Betaproteobacteria bacterium]
MSSLSRLLLPLLYPVLFLALLLTLGVWSLRAFVDFSVSPQAGFFNGKWAHAVESRYDEQFPLKRLGTNVWAALDYKLFNEGRPGVVLGRDGWLFSDEEFKLDAGAAKNIDDNLRLIAGVRQYLARHNIRLVLAIVPAKARLYREYLGERRPASAHDALYQRFHRAARDSDIIAPDLLASLRLEAEAGTEQGALFLRTDTHWTPHGADVVAHSIARAVHQQGLLEVEPQVFVTDTAPAERFSGDLLRFLPLDPLFADWLPPPDGLQRRTTRPAVAGEAAGEDVLFADVQIPVALVGTSYSANADWNFAGALRQALGSDLVNYADSGQGPLPPMLNFLQSAEFTGAPPQLVIWEFPERYLPMAAELTKIDSEWLNQFRTSAAVAINAD